MEVALGQSLVS